MRSTAAPARASASISASSFTARSGPVTSLPRRNVGGRQALLQPDQELRPGAVADGRRRRRPDQGGDQVERVVGLVPRRR